MRREGRGLWPRTAPPSGGFANSRVSLLRPLAEPCLQLRSHSQGLCPALCLLLSTFSSLGKSMPSPQGHRVLRQSSVSVSASPGWLFPCFLHFSLDALMMTGISDPIHFPNDLALLCGTVIRNETCLHLFPAQSLLWGRMAPFLLGVSRGKEVRVWKGLCFFLFPSSSFSNNSLVSCIWKTVPGCKFLKLKRTLHLHGLAWWLRQ